ncbi:LPS assembly lipoprotein LptE [Abyssalbus ytuae]|uniref:LPS assembly lipoprotein LptE n=1 Tax=Abyssalbus ytuae TaxID=2926907 RepID=A0A9E7A0K4_9FLAO|nr:LptE family protein [Abyssalbus ytuae]UOB18697.1 LPS assembly lipoprotein LptE [Abyssalbus ytuae]
MKKIVLLLILSITYSCGPYSFTGVSTTAETYQVNFFQNNAPIVEPGLDRDFTNALQDLILNQTNLDLVGTNGQLIYEGEITEFRIAPMSATAQNTAAQNRLTIGVNLRFYDTRNSDNDFEKKYSFFYDYADGKQLNEVKTEAFQVIFERITQDIFNDTLAKW